MFKKTLLALAITGFAGGAVASDIKTASEAAAVTISVEGSASKAEVEAGAVTVTLGAEYAVDDILKFSFTGGEFDAATAPTNYVTNGINAGSVTIGLLNTSNNVLTYRVTEVVAGATTIGESVVLSGLEFDRDSVVAADTVVTYSAETSNGLTIDSVPATSSATILNAENQFSIAATPLTIFDEVVDVESKRLTFEAAVTADAASFTTVSDGALTYPATAVDFDLVLSGDFAFLDEDDATAGIQTTVGTITPAPDSITATEITWEGVAVGATTLTIETANSDAVIPTQAFTLMATANYTDHGTAVLAGTGAKAGTAVVATAKDLGEWTLNGSVVEVPYMPFGPNTQPILRHTNDGSQTGDISLRYMVEGVHTSFQDAGVIVMQAAPGVRNLLTPVNDAMKAAGYDASKGGFKVAMELTSNVPAKDVKVTAAAKVTTTNSDRLSLGIISSND